MITLTDLLPLYTINQINSSHIATIRLPTATIKMRQFHRDFNAPRSHRSIHNMVGCCHQPSANLRRRTGPPRRFPQVGHQQNPSRELARVGCLCRHCPWPEYSTRYSISAGRSFARRPGDGPAAAGISASFPAGHPGPAPRYTPLSEIFDQLRKINSFQFCRVTILPPGRLSFFI